MAGVEEGLKRLIAASGPITIAQFMTEALMHPKDGYYTTRTPFGAAGDFITAPEVSQMFGELLGLWAVDYWQRAGRPAPVHLVELGPGRGTLMADFLRAARTVPAFPEAADLHLVETSPNLKAAQEKSLAQSPLQPHWHEQLMDVPDGPMILIANEFFDCLPIRQFQFTDGGWHERRVGLDDTDNFVFVLAPGTPPTAPDISPAGGAILEISPAAISVTSAIAERIRAHGGAALIIDYGYDQSGFGDTFQAVKGHAYADPLKEPGQADLTAHVDFSLLARTAREAGTAVFGPAPQGAFLKTLGVETRARTLKEKADERQRQDIDTALHRLTDAKQMGTLFKVLAITQPDGPAPAGFEGTA